MPDPTGMFVIDDWTWSTFPAPQLGVAPTHPDDAYVVVGMEDGPDRQARRLTPAQAIELADELRARALVISPALAGAAVPQPPAPCRSCGRPFSPSHDAEAPGPTARHPFAPQPPNPEETT
jgi:hypothetical protein